MYAYLSSLKLMICGPYKKDSFYIKISKNPSREGRVIKGPLLLGFVPVVGFFSLLFVMLLFCFLVSKFTIFHLFS